MSAIAIYGTVRDGYYRRYGFTTEVLAHWSTVKLAYRITLEDGTKLITSGDHRFLTQRGWKHVTGAEQGPDQRPFLTTNNKLMGFGGFVEPPKESIAYRRGYLCGMIRGDGLLRSKRYPKGMLNQFRLALVDQEGLNRTRHYLDGFGIATTGAYLRRGLWAEEGPDGHPRYLSQGAVEAIGRLHRLA